MGALRVVIIIPSVILLVTAPAAMVAGTTDTAGRDLVPGTVEAAHAAAERRPVPPRDGRSAIPDDRYELAGGCYLLRSVGSGTYIAREGDRYTAAADQAGAEPLHLEPTALGSYLLADRDLAVVGASDGLVGELARGRAEQPAVAPADGLSRGLVTDLQDGLVDSELNDATGRGEAIVALEEPSNLADWEVEEVAGGFRLHLPVVERVVAVRDGGQLALVPPDLTGELAVFRFELAEGCTPWPDVEVNVDGPVVGGTTPYGEVRGYLDAHLHGMAFEFLGGRARCGKPWSPFGVADALRGCPDHELSEGRTHLLEAFLSDRDPVAGHDTTGWPTFRDWPAHFSLTYEQTYHRWIERAWRGGLRLYVNLLVDNNKLCDAYPYKHNSCNEMDGVRLQAQQLREFERYIDAQHGGPGRGWLRIVTDPFEARRVMNEGKLAVVMGIEVSVPLDCGVVADQPQCDPDQIDRELEAVYDLGVRQMELVNKFDNALTGVAGDAGAIGIVVNGGNFLETGSFWQMGSCDEHEDHAHDNTQPNLHDDADTPEELTGRDTLAAVVLESVGTTGLAPVYAGGPHCNQRGLTDLGRYAIDRMIERGMIFDPDHMSAVARHDALDYIEERGYSGVVSSHSWSDDGIYERVYAVGGVVTPMAGSSTRFVENWRKHREWADERFFFGFGYGSDINGFASQGGPRGEDTDNKVTYPFEGFGGAVVHQQVSGERVYDINADGVAHYGLYPDWIEDLRMLAGDDIIHDLERGPEAYLQMWERAVGIAPDSCRRDVAPLTNVEVDALERGMTPEAVLLTLGQPQSRDGDVFTYCLDGGRVAEVRFRDGLLRHVRRRPQHAQAGPPQADPRRGEEPAAQPASAEAHDHGDGETTHEHTLSGLPAAASSTPTNRTGTTAFAVFLLGCTGLLLHLFAQQRRRPQRT